MCSGQALLVAVERGQRAQLAAAEREQLTHLIGVALQIERDHLADVRELARAIGQARDAVSALLADEDTALAKLDGRLAH